MKNTIETKNKYKDYTYLVIALPMGHRCGYVKIPTKSKLYKVSYQDDLGLSQRVLNHKTLGKRGVISLFCWDGKKVAMELLFDVHGGITFSGKLRDINGWWIGFDCAHAGDARDLSIMDKKHLKFEREFPLHLGGEEIRTKEYVEQECKNLIDQIIKYFPIK